MRTVDGLTPRSSQTLPRLLLSLAAVALVGACGGSSVPTGTGSGVATSPGTNTGSGTGTISGTGTGAGTGTGMAPTTLPAPSNLQVALSTPEFLQLTWDAVEGAIGYGVSGGLEGDAPPAPLATVTLREYLFTAVSPGTTYRFQVRAQGVSGLGEAASVRWTTAPGQPANVRVVGQSGERVELAWEAVPGASAYRVEACPEAGGCTVEGSVTEARYEAVIATPGSTSAWRVIATNVGGEGPASELVRATRAPAGPTITGFGNATSGSVEVSFTAEAGADRNYLQIATNAAGPFYRCGSTFGAFTTLTGIGLRPEGTYAFRAGAGNAGGITYGAVASYTLPPVQYGWGPQPATPPGITVVADAPGSLRVEWSGVWPLSTIVNVLVGPDAAGPFVPVSARGANDRFALLTELAAGTPHCVVLEAVDYGASGPVYGLASAPVCATTLP